MTIVKCKWLLLIRTHPSPSLALPLHRFVNPRAIVMFFFCFAFELDNDLTAGWRQIAAANHGRVGMPNAISICPPFDRWHHLVLLAHHLCLQGATLLSQLIAHPPEVPGSDKEREYSVHHRNCKTLSTDIFGTSPPFLSIFYTFSLACNHSARFWHFSLFFIKI